jgi:hypothetical protein
MVASNWHQLWNQGPVTSAAIGVLGGGLCALTPLALGDARWRHSRTTFWPAIVVCAMTALDLVLLTWLEDGRLPGDLKDRATVAAWLQSFVVGSLVVLGVQLVRDMQRVEQDDREKRLKGIPSAPHFEQIGKVAWFRIVGLGLAVSIVLVKIGAGVAAISGFDAEGHGRPFSLLAVAAAGIAACTVVATVRHGARPDPHASKPCVRLPRATLLWVVGALAVWAVAPHVVWHHYDGASLPWAVTFAVLLALATGHSLWFHSAGEHLAEHTPGARLAVACCTAAVASSLFWLLAAGVVDDSGPLRAAPAADVALAVLLVSGALTTLVGGVLARHRTGRFWSRYSPQQGIANDALAITGLSLLAAVLPCLFAAHVAAAPPDDSATLVLITALLAAVVQVGRFVPVFVRNMTSYVDSERAYVEKAFADDADELRHFEVTRKHFALLKWLLWIALTVASVRGLTAVL